MTKKTIVYGLLSLFMGIAMSTSAQYNKQWDYGQALDIADAGNGTVITLATDNSSDLIVSHHDFFGNILFRRYYNLVGYNTGNQAFEPSKIIVTPNGEYLVVGIYSHYDPITRLIDYAPFAVRLDASGNLLWMRLYHTSPTFSKPLIQGYSRANIVFVEDDPSMESYIITTPSDPHHSDLSYIHTYDVVINAFRIDANGTPIWNKKYRVSTPARYSTPPYMDYFATESYPQALTYYDDANGAGAYFIGGSNIRWFNYSYSQETFFMSIDLNGAIVRPFSRMNEASSGIGAYSWWNDAIFDDQNNEVVMVSSMPGWFGSGSSASVINITKFNNALGINSGDYYYHGTDVTENYAYDIEFDRNSNNFLIAAWIFDEATIVGNMAMLKVDRISMNPIFYNRYTPDHNTMNSSIISVEDQFGQEKYTMHGFPEQNPSSRLLGTDIIGDDWCRTQPLNPIHATQGFTAAPDPFEVFDVWGYQELGYELPGLTTIDYFCGLNYKKEQNTATSIEELKEENALSIFPSAVQDQNSTMTLQLALEQASPITISVYGTDGKLVSKKQFNGEIGENKLSWTQQFPSAGMYMISVTSSDTKVQETKYIIRQ